MAYKKIIELTDEQLVSFAKDSGWTETVINDKEIVNPQTAEEAVDEVIERFINNSIFDYDKKTYLESEKEVIEALRPNITLSDAK